MIRLSIEDDGDRLRANGRSERSLRSRWHAGACPPARRNADGGERALTPGRPSRSVVPIDVRPAGARWRPSMSDPARASGVDPHCGRRRPSGRPRRPRGDARDAAGLRDRRQCRQPGPTPWRLSRPRTPTFCCSTWRCRCSMASACSVDFAPRARVCGDRVHGFRHRRAHHRGSGSGRGRLPAQGRSPRRRLLRRAGSRRRRLPARSARDIGGAAASAWRGAPGAGPKPNAARATVLSTSLVALATSRSPPGSGSPSEP